MFNIKEQYQLRTKFIEVIMSFDIKANAANHLSSSSYFMLPEKGQVEQKGMAEQYECKLEESNDPKELAQKSKRDQLLNYTCDHMPIPFKVQEIIEFITNEINHNIAPPLTLKCITITGGAASHVAVQNHPYSDVDISFYLDFSMYMRNPINTQMCIDGALSRLRESVLLFLFKKQNQFKKFSIREMINSFLTNQFKKCDANILNPENLFVKYGLSNGAKGIDIKFIHSSGAHIAMKRPYAERASSLQISLVNDKMWCLLENGIGNRRSFEMAIYEATHRIFGVDNPKNILNLLPRVSLRMTKCAYRISKDIICECLKGLVKELTTDKDPKQFMLTMFKRQSTRDNSNPISELCNILNIFGIVLEVGHSEEYKEVLEHFNSFMKSNTLTKNPNSATTIEFLSDLGDMSTVSHVLNILRGWAFFSTFRIKQVSAYTGFGFLEPGEKYRPYITFNVNQIESHLYLQHPPVKLMIQFFRSWNFIMDSIQLEDKKNLSKMLNALQGLLSLPALDIDSGINCHMIRELIETLDKKFKNFENDSPLGELHNFLLTDCYKLSNEIREFITFSSLRNISEEDQKLTKSWEYISILGAWGLEDDPKKKSELMFAFANLIQKMADSNIQITHAIYPSIKSSVNFILNAILRSPMLPNEEKKLQLCANCMKVKMLTINEARSFSNKIFADETALCKYQGATLLKISELLKTQASINERNNYEKKFEELCDLLQLLKTDSNQSVGKIYWFYLDHLQSLKISEKRGEAIIYLLQMASKLNREIDTQLTKLFYVKENIEDLAIGSLFVIKQFLDTPELANKARAIWKRGGAFLEDFVNTIKARDYVLPIVAVFSAFGKVDKIHRIFASKLFENSKEVSEKNNAKILLNTVEKLVEKHNILFFVSAKKFIDEFIRDQALKENIPQVFGLTLKLGKAWIAKNRQEWMHEPIAIWDLLVNNISKCDQKMRDEILFFGEEVLKGCYSTAMPNPAFAGDILKILFNIGRTEGLSNHALLRIFKTVFETGQQPLVEGIEKQIQSLHKQVGVELEEWIRDCINILAKRNDPAMIPCAIELSKKLKQGDLAASSSLLKLIMIDPQMIYWNSVIIPIISQIHKGSYKHPEFLSTLGKCLEKYSSKFSNLSSECAKIFDLMLKEGAELLSPEILLKSDPGLYHSITTIYLLSQELSHLNHASAWIYRLEGNVFKEKFILFIQKIRTDGIEHQDFLLSRNVNMLLSKAENLFPFNLKKPEEWLLCIDMVYRLYSRKIPQYDTIANKFFINLLNSRMNIEGTILNSYNNLISSLLPAVTESLCRANPIENIYKGFYSFANLLSQSERAHCAFYLLRQTSKMPQTREFSSIQMCKDNLSSLIDVDPNLAREMLFETLTPFLASNQKLNKELNAAAQNPVEFKRIININYEFSLNLHQLLCYSENLGVFSDLSVDQLDDQKILARKRFWDKLILNNLLLIPILNDKVYQAAIQRIYALQSATPLTNESEFCSTLNFYERLFDDAFFNYVETGSEKRYFDVLKTLIEISNRENDTVDQRNLNANIVSILYFHSKIIEILHDTNEVFFTNRANFLRGTSEKPVTQIMKHFSRVRTEFEKNAIFSNILDPSENVALWMRKIQKLSAVFANGEPHFVEKARRYFSSKHCVAKHKKVCEELLNILSKSRIWLSNQYIFKHHVVHFPFIQEFKDRSESLILLNQEITKTNNSVQK